MHRDLSRLLRPRSVAVIGGGAWGRAVVEQSRKMGFSGAIWPVYPKAAELGGLPCLPSLVALPGAPDAAFVGVNRHATLDVVAELREMGAGGAVCFASGFREAQAEDAGGSGLEERLLAAAGDMPILGPNCYGFINYLDGALLWPDQHGGQREETGVAIVTQSSNIALNLTMQRRAVPLAYVVTAGNQAQTGIAAIALALLDDPRVTALGLHIEGFGALRDFEALAARARLLAKPVVALKVGRSDEARLATLSHTASLAGHEAGAGAFLQRLGIACVASLPELLETLKLLHAYGRLPSKRIASLSCSGGEASLVADTAVGRDLSFPALDAGQRQQLRAVLGPMVALANPLDYHTYIWRDASAMTRTIVAMMGSRVALTLLILDFPRRDRCQDAEWGVATQAAFAARAATSGNIAVVASLPENMPEDTARQMLRAGIVPLFGLGEALAAVEAAASVWCTPEAPPVLLAAPTGTPRLLGEAEAKSRLAQHGVAIPRGRHVTGPQAAAAAAAEIGFPVALKAQGIPHKSDAGGVALGLSSAQAVAAAARAMPATSYLVEELITDGVAELLIGAVRDPAHGFVLTLAAGGVLTELIEDRQALLIPATPAMVSDALARLRIARLLDGLRGRPAADRPAIVAAVMALQDYVATHSATLEEIEINPLICGPHRAVAADALLRCRE